MSEYMYAYIRLVGANTCHSERCRALGDCPEGTEALKLGTDWAGAKTKNLGSIRIPCQVTGDCPHQTPDLALPENGWLEHL